MTRETLLVALGALVATAALVPVCILVAHRWAIVDRPGALKSQESPVPYLGGVAVFAGVSVGVCVGRAIVLVPLAAALALGVGDDRFELPPRFGSPRSWASEPSSPRRSRCTFRVGSACRSSWWQVSSS